MAKPSYYYRIDPELKNRIDMIMKDPMILVLSVLIIFVVYIYFSNQLLFQMIALGYPCSRIYMLLGNGRVLKKDMMPILKYFVIYAHLELISSVMCFIGLSSLIHLKILAAGIMIYAAERYHEWLDNMQGKIFEYDTMIIAAVKAALQK